MDNVPLTGAQYIQRERNKGRGSSLDEATADFLKPVLFRRLLSFDAPNAYGTPIRTSEICEFVSLNGKLDRVSRGDVEVDGKSSTEWFMEIIKRSE